MGLSTLAVIFVGLAGGHHGKVEKQVGALVKQLHVTSRPMSAKAVQVLTHHDATTRDFVKKLDTDGVIACEVTSQGALRVVVYDRTGKLVSFSDSPLDHEKLSDDDLTVLRDNLSSDLESITGHPVVIDEPAPAPAPIPAPAPAPKAKAKPEPQPEPEIEIDPPAPAPAAQKSDDDAVSVDDIMGMTAQAGNESPTSIEETGAVSGDPELHIGIAAGLGVATRNFAAIPSAVAGYSSSPVAAVHLDVDVAPTKRTALRLSTERTLGMTTPNAAGDATTTVSRWEATGGYVIGRGQLAIIPTVGLGRRAFSVDAMDQGASPDNVYDYLMLGTTARLHVGKRVVVHAVAAFEPVVGGVEATEMALGEANRWAIDAGAGVDLKLGEHAHVRGAADYQSFHWAWNMAGERGAGGATDTYLTASLSIGAEY